MDRERLKELFAKAVELPPNQRETFVRDACIGDDELERELNSLLSASDSTRNVIEDNALQLNNQIVGSSTNLTNKQIGNYRVIREIGHGGMGSVYLAERSDGEFEHTVALKLVRSSIADSSIIEQFRRERQILAGLNHPNIAALYDGGVTEIGEPFIAMEYVDGESLNDYCFSAGLSLVERLQLFTKICSAVSYAHRNLIVHRDIKPSNILVGKDGEPKLLDFGLAKIAEGVASDDTKTAFRAFTPAYASPEQLRGESVTTASDIYSLGVVLYELLSGEKPFAIDDKNFQEILQTITENDPVPPSSVVSGQCKDAGNSNGFPRPAISSPQLKGDLDNIVLMSLRKEPDRRYTSAAALANDIERYLNKQPISARPNTFRYRVSKYIQRNRIAVAAAALVLVAIVIGTSVASIQYRQAQAERAKAEEVNNFLKKMLLTGNPQSQNSGYSVSLNEMLDQAAKRLDSNELDSVPGVKAELAATLGNTYSNQGLYESAEKYLKIALPLAEKAYGKDNFQTATVNVLLGNLALSRSRYDDAAAYYEPNLPIVRTAFERKEYPPENFTSLLGNLALLKRARGDSRAAEQLYRELIEIARRNSLDSGFAQTMLSLTLFDQGKFDQAENSARTIVDESRPAGQTLQIANTLTLLGSILMEKGRLAESKSSLVEAVEIYRKLLSPNAIPIYDNIRLQAQVAYLEGNYSEAENKIRSVLDNYRTNSNPKYISYATALTTYGLVLNRLGRSADAENILREALKLRKENLPPGHFLTAITEGALGECLTSRRSFAEADQHLLESLNALRQTQADNNPRIALAESRLNANHEAQVRH